jgi:D-serine deaminase-like pyridoxal phosphate-dependent protein
VRADRNQDRLSHTGDAPAQPRRSDAPADRWDPVDEGRSDAESLRRRFDRATADLDPPLAVVDTDAFDANADALVRRAAGKPLRVASKSVRCRDLLRDVLARPGWHGVMCYTLAEGIWLYGGGVGDDLLVGYPTVERAALAELAASESLASAITLMVDGVDQLDLIDSVASPAARPELRVCIDLDASWRPFGGRAHVGVRRSPLHAASAVGDLARRIADRPGFRLVGLMAYEAQIAGLGDAPAGRPARGRLIRAMQRWSYADLLARRHAAVRAAGEHADLEFVNGGGTGSVAATAADPAVTEVTSGSGLYGPTLFDGYRTWRPTPAAYFAASVVRHPGPGLVTVHGAGWIASGPAESTRLPRPTLPAGLTLLATEGAGEVQTPLSGAPADALRVGDRVWFRHAKAGELCEHVDALHLIRGDRVERSVSTYRGEHAPAFL